MRPYKSFFIIVLFVGFVNVSSAQISWTHGNLFEGINQQNVIDTLSDNMSYPDAYLLCNNKVNLQVDNPILDFHKSIQWFAFQYSGDVEMSINLNSEICGAIPLIVTYDSLYLYGPYEDNVSAVVNENAPMASFASTTASIGLGSAYLQTLPAGYYLVKYVLKSKFGGSSSLCSTAQILGGSCLMGDLCETSLTAISDDEFRLCESMSCEENLTVCDANSRLFWYYDPSCSHTLEGHSVWLSTHIDNPSSFGMTINYLTNFSDNWKSKVIAVNFYPTNTTLGDCGGGLCGIAPLTINVGTQTWSYNTSMGVLTSSDYLIEVIYQTEGAPKNQCNIASVIKFSGVSCPQQIALPDWGLSTDVDGNVSMGEASFCENCLPRLMPEPNKKYVLESWVSQNSIPFGAQTLTHPRMKVVVHHTGSSTTSVYTVNPTIIHPIVDDWQLMTLEFTTPSDVDFIDVALYSDDGSIVYFDDVRFFPFDGSMKTYVYDPVTLRFVAELDERHFATIYEYDEEGKLMRVKKETERGVMTIQETHNSTVKQP